MYKFYVKAVDINTVNKRNSAAYFLNPLQLIVLYSFFTFIVHIICNHSLYMYKTPSLEDRTGIYFGSCSP